MSKLSDNKLSKLKSLDSQGGFWYITKQNLIFRDLCFMAKILETWNDRKEENYQSFFDRYKTLPDYGALTSDLAHRATKNCEYIGLTVPSDKYSAQNLTPFYFALSKMCDGDFNKLSSYPHIVDKQLERMYIDSQTNSVYSVNFKICPFMFLFKVLLLLGDITKSFKITKAEFKLFVATAQIWSEYFEVVESILRYRNDAAYRTECDKNNNKVSDSRYQVLAQNHSQLEVDGNNISIKDSEIRNVRRKVAEYELSDKIQSAEDIFEPMTGVSSNEKGDVDSLYTPYLTALRTKPFMLLAGISGTGKSRIVREMAKACWTPEEDEYGKNCPRNFCMVQVKPNWHDSSDLIGYVSRINGEKYVVGPFLRFTAKAIKDPKRPYFLCLDEMNLAPVEQYFAEYLSVIESRKLQDGQIETDPIVPYENTEAYGSLIDQLFDSDEERKAYKTEEGGKRLTIPENLFVVGTVNMDETTFSFSRKVLDRAMTIEMNEVDLKGGLEAGGSAEFGYIGEDLMGDAAEGKDIYADNQTLCDDIIAYLGKVNEILEGTPFKIAYRTRNEFLLYAVNRLHFATDSELWQTLDEMTSMKILSRIEGDNERCERVLREMKQLLTETVGEHAPDSVSLKKIDEMTLKLKSGYTSYWA